VARKSAACGGSAAATPAGDARPSRTGWTTLLRTARLAAPRVGKTVDAVAIAAAKVAQAAVQVVDKDVVIVHWLA